MNGGGAPTGRWWLDPGLAKLAFGSAPARGRGGPQPPATHLAFLPPEALELDLDDPAQSELGDYHLEELIGQGGMGVVYRARQKTLEREVALKLLSAGPWASDEFIASFRREARNAASLQHPNIVTVYEMGEQDGLIFYAMQLVRGRSLAEHLRERGRLPPHEAATLLRTVAEAVDYAHRMGVLHLDLKPGNVLINPDGVAMVTDFGLARRLGQAPSVENEQVSGTPSYMAPEQAQVRNIRLSPATDLWGLGAILYEMLAGVPPFTGRDPHEILVNVLNGTVRKLSRHAATPPDLEAICLRCLRKEPGERYASARELADDLGRFLEHRSVTARPLNRLQRIGRWAEREPKLALASVMAVTALATGLVATTHQWTRAEANARVASERLWEGRREAALQLEAQGAGWDAARRLMQNLGEQDAHGVDAAADRLRLGLLMGQGARLLDATLVADATPLALALDPAGERLALATGDRELRWYDATTLVEQGRIRLGERRSSGGELRATVRLRFAGTHHVLATQEWYRHLPRPTDGDTWLVDLKAGRVVEPPPGFADFSDAAFSDDGRTALLRDHRGRVQTWAVEPWRPMSPLLAGPDAPSALPWRLSPGGELALAASNDQREVHVYALPALAPLHVRPLPLGARVSAWAVAPGGARIAMGDDEGRLYLLERDDWSLHQLPVARGREVTWVAFSEDGAWLVAGAEDGRVHAFDAHTGDPLVSGSMDHDFPVRRVGVQRGQRLVVVTGEGARALWRLPAKEGPRALPAIRVGLPPAPHARAGAHAVDWTDDGLLASAGLDGALRLWRLPASAYLPATLAHQVAESPVPADGRVVDVAWDQLRVLGADGRGTAWHRLPGPPGFAELADGGRMVLATVDRSLLRLDARDLSPHGQALALPGTPQRLLLSDDGRRAWLSFPDRDEEGFIEVLRAWDLRSGAPLPGEARLRGPLLQLSLPSPGRLLAVGPADGATQLLSTDNLATLAEWPHDPFEPIVSADAAPGEQALWLLARATDPHLGQDALLRWQPGEDELRSRQVLASRPFAVAALPGGRAFVAGETAHALVHPDGTTETIARGRDASDGRLGALARHAGQRLLAVSSRHGVRLFNEDGLPIGRTLRLAAPPLDGIFDIAFDAAGEHLFVRTVHGAARWPVAPPGDEARLARQLAWLAADEGLHGALALPTPAERARLRADDPGAWPRPTPAPPPEVAARGRADGSPIPPRVPGTPPQLLDLSGVYAFGPTAVRNSASALKPFLRPWPAGRVHLGGVGFDVRGMADAGPEGLGGCVPVPPGPVAAVHALVLPVLRSPETTPRVLAELDFHYADGSRATVPLRATRELHGYGGGDQQVPHGFTVRIPRSAMGFHTGTAAVPRLANPHPERPLRCLDLRSTGEPQLLFALTVAPPGAAGETVAEPVIAAR